MTMGHIFSGLACYRPNFGKKRWGDSWRGKVPQYQGTSHCGLCRLHFPAKSSIYGEFPPSEAWQYKYRALVSEDPTGEKGVQMTEVMTGTPFTDHIGVKKPRGKRKLSKYRPPESVAYCIHEWCYAAFEWKTKRCPPPLMYRLIRASTYQSSPWQNDYRDRRSRSLWGLYPGAEFVPEVPMDCLSNCPAELQPLFLARLPAEIRASIWKYAQNSAYAAFLRVTGESALLAHRLRKSTTTNYNLYRESAMFAENVDIFDTTYIQDLVATPPDDPAEAREVCALRFVAGEGGICAICPVIQPDIVGDWIGTIPAGGSGPLWYGTVLNFKGEYKFKYNDLNLIGISSDSELQKQIVWDRPDYPQGFGDPEAVLFDYDPQRELDDLAPEREPFSHVRMFKYLPFMKGRDYMTGLTVYCGTAGGDDGLRMTGIEAHFENSSQLSGSCDGCAMYFHFSPGEKIACIWLRSCGDPWSGYLRPSLVIQTTFSRRHHFGPYLSPEWIEEDASDPYWWIRLENKGFIRGIYYEQPIHNPYFRSIGVIDDANPLRIPASTPQYHNWPNSRCPRWIGTPDKDLYISTAFLDPLESITICKVGERCTGMMIRFSPSRITVLGQWQQASRSEHIVIFQSWEQKSINLWFQMKRYYPRENSTATTISHIVTDIGVSEDGKVEMLSGRDYRAFSPGEEMAWWFTDKYDLIKNSSGEILEVPEARMLRQKAFMEELVT